MVQVCLNVGRAVYGNADVIIVGLAVGSDILRQSNGGVLGCGVCRIVADAVENAGDGCGCNDMAGSSLLCHDGKHKAVIPAMAYEVCICCPLPVSCGQIEDIA